MNTEARTGDRFQDEQWYVHRAIVAMERRVAGWRLLAGIIGFFLGVLAGAITF